MIINQVGGGGEADIHFGKTTGSPINGILSVNDDGVYGTGVRVIPFPKDDADEIYYGDGKILRVTSAAGVIKKEYDSLTNTVNVVETTPIQGTMGSYSVLGYWNEKVILDTFQSKYDPTTNIKRDFLRVIDMSKKVDGKYVYSELTMKVPTVDGMVFTNTQIAGMWKGYPLVYCYNSSEAIFAAAEFDINTQEYTVKEYIKVDQSTIGKPGGFDTSIYCLASGDDWMIMAGYGSQDSMVGKIENGVATFTEVRTGSYTSGTVAMKESTGISTRDMYKRPVTSNTPSGYPPLTFTKWDYTLLNNAFPSKQYGDHGMEMIASDIGIAYTESKGSFLFTVKDGIVKKIPMPDISYKSSIPLVIRYGLDSPPDGGYINKEQLFFF